MPPTKPTFHARRIAICLAVVVVMRWVDGGDHPAAVAHRRFLEVVLRPPPRGCSATALLIKSPLAPRQGRNKGGEEGVGGGGGRRRRRREHLLGQQLPQLHLHLQGMMTMGQPALRRSIGGVGRHRAVPSQGEEEEEEEGDAAAAASPKRRRDSGTADAQILLRPRRPPRYDAKAQAREVFANPYFYNDKRAAVEFNRLEREAAFGEDMTVGEVYVKYFTGAGRRKGGGGGAMALSREICANDLRLDAYFAGAEASLETLLAREEVVTLDESDAVAVFLDRRVEGGVPTSLAVFQAQTAAAAQAVRTRPKSYRLCFVLGSSGSGKTFFCLEHLREFLNVGDSIPSVMLYLKAASLGGEEGFVDWARRDAPARVVDQIRGAFEDFIETDLRRVWDPSAQLKMHVCLVIDEAGDSSTQGFFDNRHKVMRLLAKLRLANLALSGTLVVCGTGLVTQTFSSDREAYYFRMRPWTRSDLEQVLQKYLAKAPNDLPPKIAEAVSHIPLLDALSTNGRTAYFMVGSIVEATRRTSALMYLGWQAHVSSLVPEIVNSVVFRYTNSNGIESLNEDQRRRVSAWMLGALSQLKSGTLKIPEFPGLEPVVEAKAALLLLQINVQRLGGEICFVPGEEFCASVTPALAIVLFNMAGVFTGLISGWRGEEEVAALYAAEQSILERWSKHEKAVREMQRVFVTNRDSMDMAKFRTALRTMGETKVAEHENLRLQLENEFAGMLKEVRVYRLQKQLQSWKKSAVMIPVVSKHSILVNAERSSFADVVAPYMLLQTKHTATPHETMVWVNLTAELNKCCLLKHNTRSDRAVRGLLALWNGSLSAWMINSAEGKEGTAVNNQKRVTNAPAMPRPLQGSRAFPANQIKFTNVTDGITYAEILPNGQVKGTTIVLPDKPSTLNITFLLSTNAERLRLDLSKRQKDECVLIVTEDSLDGDMEVDQKKLPNKRERVLWGSFQESLFPGVKVRFLFTRSRS